MTLTPDTPADLPDEVPAEDWAEQQQEAASPLEAEAPEASFPATAPREADEADVVEQETPVVTAPDEEQ